MQKFLEGANSRLKSRFDKLEKSRDVFMKTLIFYKFIPKTGTIEECTPGHFFELWQSFTHDFRDIWIKEQNAIKNEL